MFLVMCAVLLQDASAHQRDHGFPAMQHPSLALTCHCVTPLVTNLQVFIPSHDESEVPLFKYTWYRAGFLAVQSLLGWPLYLFFNVSGREYSRVANHFDPTSPIFSKRERPGEGSGVCCWQWWL
jgi:hypothetical protein